LEDLTIVVCVFFPALLIILLLHNKHVVDEFNRDRPFSIKLSSRMRFVAVTALTALIVVLAGIFLVDYIFTGRLYYLIANDEYSVSRYKSAEKYYFMASRRGNVDAMIALGRMYAQGKGVDKDLAKAKKLFSDAVARGSCQAMCELGILILDENVPAPDYDTARKYLENASGKGYASAQYKLGTIYLNGLGGPRDLEKAKELFRSASLKNNEAKLELLIMAKQDELTAMDKEENREEYEKCRTKLQLLSSLKSKDYRTAMDASLHLATISERGEPGYNYAVRKIAQLDKMISLQEKKDAGKEK